jgi:two-component system response regulator AtoC
MSDSTLIRQPIEYLDTNTADWLEGEHNATRCVSPSMQSIESLINDLAPADIPILIIGETGTGKEVIALQIHRRSSRRVQPFAKVNCAGLQPNDLDRCFLEASAPPEAGGVAGTLFLDEINEMDAACQARLLHLLSQVDGPSDSKMGQPAIISASCRSLEEETRVGHFRDELYYRVSGVCVRVPPLRHRKEDIPVLADFFMEKYSRHYSKPQRHLTLRGLRTLAEYHWPGNVRELENTIKKVVALGDERLALSDLATPPAPPPAGDGRADARSLKEAARAASRQAERELILKVLTQTRWNRKRAAQELKISYKALLYKLKQIGMEDSVHSLPDPSKGFSDTARLPSEKHS